MLIFHNVDSGHFSAAHAITQTFTTLKFKMYGVGLLVYS